MQAAWAWNANSVERQQQQQQQQQQQIYQGQGRMQPPAPRGEQRRLLSVARTPPRDDAYTASSQEKNQQPPLSFVLVRETTTTPSVSSVDFSGQFPRPSMMMHGSVSMPSSSSSSSITADTASGTFRLQPRGGKGACSPFSSSSSRGRKRNSECLSPCSATIQTEGTVGPNNSSSSLVNSPGTCTHESGTTQTCTTQPEVESAMLGLSIQSPRVVRRLLPLEFAPMVGSPYMRSSATATTPTSTRLPLKSSFLGSSFISYTSSPGAARLRPKGEDCTAGGSQQQQPQPQPKPMMSLMSSPASSSAKSSSSPRFAPLTVVLPKPVNAMGTPTNRPPRHHGGQSSSSLLFSLDGSSSSSQHQDCDELLIGHGHYHHAPSQAAGSSSPLLPRAVAVAYSPAGSASSTITKEFTPARPKRTAHPSTPEQHSPFLGSSPSGIRPSSMMIMSSPATPATCQSVHSAHHHSTPLPNVKLTPRNTPRSAASNANGSMVSTPHSARELGLLPDDFDLDLLSKSSSTWMKQEQCSSEWNTTAPRLVRATPLPSTTASLLPIPTRLSYLPIPDWCDASPKMVQDSGPEQALPHLTTQTHSESIFLGNVPGVGEGSSHLHTRSLLAPPGGRGFPFDMMLHQGRTDDAMDSDGSLSDPDEEAPFVLMNPANLAASADERHGSGGPARQRQRLSYNNSTLDQSNARASCMSLSTAHASNTSLLGVGFLRGDSMASLSRQTAGTGGGTFSRSLSFKCETTPGATFAFGHGNHRQQSDQSLASIGLPVEQADGGAPPSGEEDGGRDLVTPPPFKEDSFTCPLPPMSCGDKPPPPLPPPHKQTTPPPRSVCFSSSNPAAVHECIARMAYQSGHNHNMSPQMECHS